MIVTAQEQQLMQRIFVSCGATIHLAVGTAEREDESFLAALIAGESGGDLNAKRFEPAVLVSLWEVLLGRKANFGSISPAMLVCFLTGATRLVAVPTSFPANALQRLDGLATSWGYTQIMGYNALAAEKTPDYLRDPRGNLDFAVAMLHQFADRFHLNLATDFEKLFRCWNTGRPDGETKDPAYVSNGLVRMTLYQQILANPGALTPGTR